MLCFCCHSRSSFCLLMISDTVGERGRRREEGEIERGGRGKREINKKCCFVFLAPPLPVGVLWCCLITYMLLRFLLLLLLAVLVCRRLVLHWTPDNPKPEYRQAHGRGTQVHPVVLCLPRLLSEPCKVCPFILFSQSPSPSAQCLHFVVCVCGCMSVGVCLWVFVCGFVCGLVCSSPLSPLSPLLLLCCDVLCRPYDASNVFLGYSLLTGRLPIRVGCAGPKWTGNKRNSNVAQT